MKCSNAVVRQSAWRRMSWCVTALGIAVLTGCVPGTLPPEFPGRYDVTRGTAEIRASWIVDEGPDGEVVQDSAGGELEPLDANDLPEFLATVADEWNQGLDDFNANLDQVFPNQVDVSHPRPLVVRVTSTEDPNGYFEGLNTTDGFVALAGGIHPGVLGAGMVRGEWDGEDTITGNYSISLTFAGNTPNRGGYIVTIAIVVPYEAVLVPEE